MSWTRIGSPRRPVPFPRAARGNRLVGREDSRSIGNGRQEGSSASTRSPLGVVLAVAEWARSMFSGSPADSPVDWRAATASASLAASSVSAAELRVEDERGVDVEGVILDGPRVVCVFRGTPVGPTRH